MVKKIALLLLFLGIGSAVAQIMAGEATGSGGKLIALSWVNHWGEETGWGIRGLLVFIGGGLMFLEKLMGDDGLEGEVKK
jgi:hypothetical protein